jgi:hypothetical protein
MKDWHTMVGLCDLRFDHRHPFAILFKHKHNPQVVAAAVSHHYYL